MGRGPGAERARPRRLVASGPLVHARLEGAERIPAQGGALLVGNHSFLGLDGFVLAALVNREAGRYLRFLGKAPRDIPALGPLLTRLGAVAGEPEVAVSMLEAGDLVAVYPGGIDDSWKPKAERYRLRWGQRAGFARVAMRAGIPIIPVAGLGIDDAYDVVGRERKLGRAIFGSSRYDLPIAFGALGTLAAAAGASSGTSCCRRSTPGRRGPARGRGAGPPGDLREPGRRAGHRPLKRFPRRRRSPT